jgi:hypothetical protein
MDSSMMTNFDLIFQHALLQCLLKSHIYVYVAYYTFIQIPLALFQDCKYPTQWGCNEQI